MRRSCPVSPTNGQARLQQASTLRGRLTTITIIHTTKRVDSRCWLGGCDCTGSCSKNKCWGVGVLVATMMRGTKASVLYVGGEWIDGTSVKRQSINHESFQTRHLKTTRTRPVSPASKKNGRSSHRATSAPPHSPARHTDEEKDDESLVAIHRRAQRTPVGVFLLQPNGTERPQRPLGATTQQADPGEQRQRGRLHG